MSSAIVEMCCKSLAQHLVHHGARSINADKFPPTTGFNMFDESIRPIKIDVADEQLRDLQARLGATRWPSRETVDDWSQGVPLEWMQRVVRYWLKEYDWRARESRMNQFNHFVTNIDSLDIHFIHAPSPHPNATPVIMTHGWPGSFVEFLKVIDELSDPVAYGGSAEDALSIVVPSLPGFGLSGKPTGRGWTIDRIAAAWGTLMERLGYAEYVMNGTDWGSYICLAGTRAAGADRIRGLALNAATANPGDYDFEPDAEEERFHAHNAEYFETGHGYSAQQSTRPQALGYGLEDSPVGLAGWILDKFASWVDHHRELTDVLSMDDLLDNVMIYWLNGVATSSARLYYESFGSLFADNAPITKPVTYTRANDVFVFSEREIRTRFSDLRRFSVAPAGGHFLAFEQPEFFVRDLRDSVRQICN
ncbi:epoxide hydrolase family protein [Gordonia terrae]